MNMRAGTAWVDITPTKPLDVAGQLHRRIGEYTHDPLTANAAAFDDGGVRSSLVSCDLLFLPTTSPARCSRTASERSASRRPRCSSPAPTHTSPPARPPPCRET